MKPNRDPNLTLEGRPMLANETMYEIIQFAATRRIALVDVEMLVRDAIEREAARQRY
jgi:hypothetical protein